MLDLLCHCGRAQATNVVTSVMDDMHGSLLAAQTTRGRPSGVREEFSQHLLSGNVSLALALTSSGSWRWQER
jgi:hypothetical protein